MFNVNFSIDSDKLDPATGQAGDLSVRYNSPHGVEPNIGHWNYSGRYEAVDEAAMALEVCAKFEDWKAKRMLEIGIEANLRAELAPLCPCYEEPEPEPEPQP